MSGLLSQLNRMSLALSDSLTDDDLDVLDIRRVDDLSPANVLDFGIDRVGTIEAGMLLTGICAGGLLDVRVTGQFSDPLPVPVVEVVTDQPLLACMAAQYAGWPFALDDYFAICSGPARIARGKEELLKEFDLITETINVVGVFETAQLPEASHVAAFAEQCGHGIENVTLCIARTASLPGTIQVIARSVEATLHKLHEIDFDLCTIKRGFGRAPLAPVGADDLSALGRTNDAILYGATVNLWIDADDETLASVGPKVPSCSSSDFGTPFIETFEKYDRDFFKIDKMLFSPARVVMHSLRSGNLFSFGEIRPDILSASFGVQPPE
ncbi:MAG: methenyltetrahydromethanopterin cyclohydrolase [Planctomycetota bacterium]